MTSGMNCGMINPDDDGRCKQDEKANSERARPCLEIKGRRSRLLYPFVFLYRAR
jgi:hypothetical protein